MACVVHYDLFGLFPTYPYGRHARNTADERRPQKQQQEPEQKQRYYEPVQSAIDDMWIPRPGTDPHSQFQRPTIVVHDYGDYRTDASDYWMDDDYWTEVTDVENDDRALDRDDGHDDDDDDDDESWTEVTTDADDGGADGTGRKSAGSDVQADGAAGGDTCQAPPRSPVTANKGCDGVMTVVEPPLSPLLSFDDDYEYDEDYMAPGEERDDDVF